MNKANLGNDNSSWIMDLRASHHVTKDLQNLSMFTKYDVDEELYVGDGTSLLIINSGKTIIQTTSKPLHLNNVLHVPSIQNNLISVSKL